MCQLGQCLTFCKTTDPYEVGIPLDEIMVTSEMLWHGFPISVTKEMTQNLRHYDFCPISLSPLVVIATSV